MAESRRAISLPGLEKAKAESDAVMKWLEIWGDVLATYGMLGMDLANYPDRLDTHA